MKPLAIDLFCGLGGWTEGLLAEGYDVIGFDIERHEYGEHRYPGLLVVQDVMTLHGSQFKNAALIVASPPCQEYSYMAMPWTKAKAKAKAIRADTTGAELERLTRLFNACFRIQREACEAAGRHIPLIVENVKGAQPWVGRARWSFGSFYLWGDIPALMPMALKHVKVPTMGAGWYPPGHPKHVAGLGFNTHADRNLRASLEGTKGEPYETGNKNNGGSWFAIAHNKASGKGQNPDGRKGVGPRRDPATGLVAQGMKRWTNPAEGTKNGSDWFGAGDDCSLQRRHGSKSSGRKMASAMIAKIPLPLSRHIAATFR